MDPKSLKTFTDQYRLVLNHYSRGGHSNFGVRRQRAPERRQKGRISMTCAIDVHGRAALAICESLLLAMNERNILPEREIIGILEDAAAAHAGAPTDDDDHELHVATAMLIERIISGGNSVRRS